MAYQLITNRNAHPNNFSRGRGGRKIEFIVIHHWDDPRLNPKFESILRVFENPKRKASAHYVAEAGRVACMVNESDTAWHAGNFRMNQRSIGIECNPRCSEEDKATIGELVWNLRQRYGNLQIIGHKDVSSTGCPGRYYPPAQVLAPYIKPSGGAHALPVHQEPEITTKEESTMRIAHVTDNGQIWLIQDGQVPRHLSPEEWQGYEPLGLPMSQIGSNQIARIVDTQQKILAEQMKQVRSAVWGYKNPNTTAGTADAYKMLREAAGREEA